MKKILRPLVIGNWKMNPQSVKVAQRLYTDVRKGLARVGDVDVVVAPPAVFIHALHSASRGSQILLIGAQDAHFEKLGPHTGDISLPMLQSVSVSHVILGHSERRALGETNEMVHKKVLAALKSTLTPVVCVGEKERDAQAHYFRHIEKQITSACAGVSKAKISKLVIAYEPLWAISTGDGRGATATSEDIYEMKLFIQKVLTDMFGRNVAMKIRVLYGGSVNAKNAPDLMKNALVDGFLVGGASLKASEFIEIVKTAKSYE